MPPGNNSAKPASREICTYCRRKSCQGPNSHVQSHTIDRIRPPIVRTATTSLLEHAAAVQRVIHDGTNSSSDGNTNDGNHREGQIPSEVIPRRGTQNIQSNYQAISGSSNNVPSLEASTSSVAQVRTSNESNTKTVEVACNAIPTSKDVIFDTTERIVQFTPEHHSEVSEVLPKNSGLKDEGMDKITIRPSSTEPNERKSVTSNLGKENPPRSSDFQNMGKKPVIEKDAFAWKNLQTTAPVGNAGSSKITDKILQTVSRNTSANEIKENCNNGKLSDDDDFVWVDVTHGSHTIKHSSSAMKYEGVVEQILNSRTAQVKVAEINGRPIRKSQWGSANAIHKIAQLFVIKLQPSKQEPFYPSGTLMNSVLQKGEVIFLICSPHKSQRKTFDLFAHQAWKIVNENQQNNESKRDAYITASSDSMDVQSVTSTCSQPGSDTQRSISSRSCRRRRNKKENTINSSKNFGDAVWDWLDANINSSGVEYDTNWNGPEGISLVEGWLYIGKVTELRLPYAFVVEVSTNNGKQWIFVFSSHYRPLGHSYPTMKPGVSIRDKVSVGDEIAVIPSRNASEDKRKFEWVAKDAWPNDQLATSTSDRKVPNNLNQFNLNNTTGQLHHSSQPVTLNCSSGIKKWKAVSGVILTLHFNWGLVREEVRCGSTYVFKRKNTFLFGLCLKDFVLPDVLQEGQLVKFYLENEDFGEMNVCELHCGNVLPDMCSFLKAVNHYCQDIGIKASVEDSLVIHGQGLY